MSEPRRVLILKSTVKQDDGGFREALIEALRRVGMVIEEADLSGDSGELLERLAQTALTIVLKPC
jgi:hypothetical protein